MHTDGCNNNNNSNNKHKGLLAMSLYDLVAQEQAQFEISSQTQKRVYSTDLLINQIIIKVLIL